MASAYEAGEVDVATSLSSTVMELYEGKEDLYLTEQIATRYIYFNLNVETPRRRAGAGGHQSGGKPGRTLQDCGRGYGTDVQSGGKIYER